MSPNFRQSMKQVKSATPSSYAELLKRVRVVIAAGKERALEAVERESVRTKWEVGKLIREHILLNKSRADYGARIILRLSKDLGISKRELEYSVEFARTYPIAPPAAQLSWGHVRELLAVNEPEQRKGLIDQASRHHWTRPILRREIRKLKAAKQITVSEAPAKELLVPRKGTLDTYRIITAKAGSWAGELALDLGFANYHLPAESLQRFQDRDIVELVRTGLKPASTWKIQKSKRMEQDLFTYRAYLLQVTDGDTLWVLIDLGFGFVTQQHLRLRGLDAPEITSRSGQEARRFVERELKKVSYVVITSTKSDKYDRYLADVFYTLDGEERYLNNRLLERGLAEVES